MTEARTKSISTRFSEGEIKDIDEAVKIRGLKTRSAFIREAVKSFLESSSHSKISSLLRERIEFLTEVLVEDEKCSETIKKEIKALWDLIN